MLLHGLKISSQQVDISILGDKIGKISLDKVSDCSSSTNIYFDNCCVFPGLINSHDHLDFNLFPPLGNQVYKNYLDWGTDIHQKNNKIIQSVLAIPKPLRAQWGIYKNLISGVTTVVQHGEQLDVPNNLISVFSNCNSLHSVQLEKHWKRSLNKPLKNNRLFVIHTGEGTDQSAHKEIDKLIRWNLFRKKIVAVHGIAMNELQSKNFEALVWCPDSNFFLYNKTASIDKLKTSTEILFGTDSTVSANWNIWHQLRLARESKMLSDKELIKAVTSNAAKIWHLNNTGEISGNFYADLIIVKEKIKNDDAENNFFGTNPEDIQLILHKGNIVLFDTSLINQLKNISLKEYSTFYINNETKYVLGNISGLIKKIKHYMPEAKFPIDAK